jgi:2-polyprenyl-3-methyl-5-hydroxy-6-metoxy-1,4-benzoquinol methylase
VAEFLDGDCILDPLIRGEFGDIKGRSLLHLRCHFGLDTLSLARLGATVTGVDFSSKAVATARKLSTDSGVPGRFIEGRVEDVPSLIDEQFDRVFTSWGVIMWLSDLAAWAVASDHL